MDDENQIRSIAAEFGLITGNETNAVDKQWLVDKINDLVNTDFAQLVFLLYRVDVNETSLKKLLKENPGTDAGLIIADMVIERQLQKLKSKQAYRPPANDIDEKDRW